MLKPRIIAHRGDSAHYPDNTWAGIRGAFAAGADTCEVDLQRCADGTIVLCHEYAIAGRPIAEMPLTEFGSTLPDAPILEELLDWAEEQAFPLLLEVKDAEMLEALTDCLSSHSPELFTVSSFHGPFLREFAQRCPNIATSLMLGTVLDIDDMLLLARRYKCSGVHPCWESRDPYPHQLLTREAVDRLREEGYRVTLWHEERTNELRALLDLSPDAICTNTPAALKWLRDGDG